MVADLDRSAWRRHSRARTWPRLSTSRPTVAAFGVERCMFGTNWPVDSLYGSYRRQVDAYRTIVAEAGFSTSE